MLRGPSVRPFFSWTSRTALPCRSTLFATLACLALFPKVLLLVGDVFPVGGTALNILERANIGLCLFHRFGKKRPGAQESLMSNFDRANAILNSRYQKPRIDQPGQYRLASLRSILPMEAAAHRPQIVGQIHEAGDKCPPQ